MSSAGSGCLRPLAPKKSPEDILQLFNAAPGSQLFAGSPAQDHFFQPIGPPTVRQPDLGCLVLYGLPMLLSQVGNLPYHV